MNCPETHTRTGFYREMRPYRVCRSARHLLPAGKALSKLKQWCGNAGSISGIYVRFANKPKNPV